MADNSFPTYQTISKPYDALMNRVGGDMNNIENGITITGQSNLGSTLDVIRGPGTGSAAAPASATNTGAGVVASPADIKQDVVGGQAMSNTWVNSWIKSTNYLPKKVGFFIDGQNGYIECRDFYSNNATIASGTISGTNIQTISPADSIQAAIDSLHAKGGGTLRITRGTYTVNSPITVYSNITIQGDNPNTTIIDFNNTASSFNLIGTDVYTDGTVVAAQVIGNNQFFFGGGTAWDASMVGRYIFIGKRWYQIVAVPDATTIITAEDYVNNTTFPCSYRIASVLVSSSIENLTFTNSLTSAVILYDTKNIFLKNCTLYKNQSGARITNAYFTELNTIIAIKSTDYGFSSLNTTFLNGLQINANSCGGNGFQAENYDTGSIATAAFTSNGGNGMKFVNTSGLLLQAACTANSQNGIQFYSGCDDNLVDSSIFSGNSFNGIELTATSDNNSFGSNIIVEGNGWYGISIAAASCDTNAFIYSLISGNFVDQINDQGTGTIIIGREPVGEIYFGDGSDGDVTISGNTTLTADMYYNNLTINNGYTLYTGGYKIFVKDTLTNNGTISRSGNDGSNGGRTVGGAAGGTALSAGTLSGTPAGGFGGSYGGAGGNGSSAVYVLGSAGAAGGAGQQGTGGGTAGTITSVSINKPRNLTSAFLMADFSPTFTLQNPSTGSGGGGCSGWFAYWGGGGGGGSAGGIMVIFANQIINNGSIISKGGNGGNAYQGGGGGGGANGGYIVVVYTTKTGSGTVTAPRGEAGSGATDYGFAGNGANGSPGVAGTVIYLAV